MKTTGRDVCALEGRGTKSVGKPGFLAFSAVMPQGAGCGAAWMVEGLCAHNACDALQLVANKRQIGREKRTREEDERRGSEFG